MFWTKRCCLDLLLWTQHLLLSFPVKETGEDTKHLQALLTAHQVWLCIHCGLTKLQLQSQGRTVARNYSCTSSPCWNYTGAGYSLDSAYFRIKNWIFSGLCMNGKVKASCNKKKCSSGSRAVGVQTCSDGLLKEFSVCIVCTFPQILSRLSMACLLLETVF